MKKILPDLNLRGGNETIFVFLDHNYIFTNENVVSDITIPNMKGFFKKLKNNYNYLFKVKSSKNLKITGEYKNHFKLRKNELMDVNKNKQKASSITSLSAYQDLAPFNLEQSEIDFIHTIQTFMNENFVEKLPDIIPTKLDGGFVKED